MHVNLTSSDNPFIDGPGQYFLSDTNDKISHWRFKLKVNVANCTYSRFWDDGVVLFLLKLSGLSAGNP